MPMKQFSRQLLAWFDQHGRTHLPWQQDVTPYRVWVSEIMLQQTQVTTAIPYYQRFLQRFPDVESLASAELDEVLHYWSGLGYYSRAKNLHSTAQRVTSEFSGHFPQDLATLMSLPGIGRSTAGAILAIAHKKRAVILDGNVKRVLTRYRAITGWPGQASVLNQLWELADSLTPQQRIDDYTQAIMDLGATLCTRSKPACSRCPLQSDCLAYAENRIAEFPARKPKKQLPIKATIMLAICHNDHVLLQKRPFSGIWPGLWGFPEINTDEELVPFCRQQLQATAYTRQALPGFRHTFSHYHLDIRVEVIYLQQKPRQVMADQHQLWYNMQSPQPIGFAAPVGRILTMIEKA